MHDSRPDDIGLATAVESRFLDLCGAYKRIKGVKLTIPLDLLEDAKMWRAMRRRHMSGDFRNTDAELQATQVMAQWTLDVNCEMRNQVSKRLVWG